jgi:hypothetical protein
MAYSGTALPLDDAMQSTLSKDVKYTVSHSMLLINKTSEVKKTICASPDSNITYQKRSDQSRVAGITG